VDHIEKSGAFNVYRSGDRRAASAADLLTLRTAIDKLKEGNETARSLTTVIG
jgi:hypothetical protein